MSVERIGDDDDENENLYARPSPEQVRELMKQLNARAEAESAEDARKKQDLQMEELQRETEDKKLAAGIDEKPAKKVPWKNNRASVRTDDRYPVRPKRRG